MSDRIQPKNIKCKYLPLPIDGGYDCGVDDVNEIAVFVQLKY